MTTRTSGASTTCTGVIERDVDSSCPNSFTTESLTRPRRFGRPPPVAQLVRRVEKAPLTALVVTPASRAGCRTSFNTREVPEAVSDVLPDATRKYGRG